MSLEGVASGVYQRKKGNFEGKKGIPFNGENRTEVELFTGRREGLNRRGSWQMGSGGQDSDMKEGGRRRECEEGRRGKEKDGKNFISPILYHFSLLFLSFIENFML